MAGDQDSERREGVESKHVAGEHVAHGSSAAHPSAATVFWNITRKLFGG